MPTTRFFLPSSVLMCDPHYFRVSYVINPWMKLGSVNQSHAVNQWQVLKKTFESLGCVVSVMPGDPRYPDMVFMTDQGYIIGDQVLLSKFRFQERHGESKISSVWFASHGLRVIPSSFFFEGGDCMSFGPYTLLGVGFRSQPQGKGAVELQLVDDRFYHLDTCLFVLDSQTVFYYPSAFSKDSQMWLENHVPHLHVFHPADALGFAANSVVIGETVINQPGNSQFISKIAALGFDVKLVDVSEFMKSGGGIHCLSIVLGKETYAE